MDDQRSLLQKYLIGPAEVGGTILGGLGAQAVNGLGMLQGQDPQVQAPQLGESGQATLRDLAPAYYGIKHSPVGKAAGWLGDQYGKSVQMYSDLAGKYLGAPAAGIVGAAGEVAPALLGPGGKEKAIAGATPDALEALAAHHATNGGSTFHPGTGTMPSSGYSVSLHPGRAQILDNAPTGSDLRNYVAANKDAFESDPGAHLGTWYDAQDSKKHYLDVSHVDPDLASALEKAKGANQKAIFDLGSFQEIPNPHYNAAADTQGAAASPLQSMHDVHSQMQQSGNDPLLEDGANRFTLAREAEARRRMAEDGIQPQPYSEPFAGRQAEHEGAVALRRRYLDQPEPLENNASGESAASLEAINRTAQEQSAGQQRYMLHPDDSVTPVSGVGAADARAYPGAVLVQRGIGEGPGGYSILDRGGLPQAHAQGRLNAALSRGDLDPPAFAEGGEVGTALGGLGEMMAKYAPEAAPLAEHVAQQGGVTYSPVSGDLHRAGTITLDHSSTQALDHAPDPGEIHDYLMQHQDTLAHDPASVLHITSDDQGNHFMRVGTHEPEMPEPEGGTPQDLVDKYLSSGLSSKHPVVGNTSSDYSSRVSTPWTPGQQTVANPNRNAFPGVYNDPRTVIQDASSKVGPEDPLLRQLFGVSRSDLSDLALSRQGNELGVLPGEKPNPSGSAAAHGVMTPANEQRLIDVLSEARKSPGLYQGMTGWYAMDPLFQRFVAEYGPEEAIARYQRFNTLTGMASPGSDVGTEIARGTSANWLHNQGRFSDFVKYAGGVEDAGSAGRPADMSEIPGHVYHRTAQAFPMQQYLESGQTQMKSPKVPMYIAASGVPETGFQTSTPVGDAHWARGVGLADTRGTRTSKGQEIVPGSSVSTPEMQQLAPWWRDRVASPAGLESVPAQALAWGAFSPYTGVKSAIGAPKLEILSTQIGKLAQRLGISPEDARDRVIRGEAGAFAEGGKVGTVLSGLSELMAKYAPDMKPITNTVYRGTESGTPGAALRKASDGEIGPGIYYTPHKWLASSYGGGPGASVKKGTRTVHEATLDALAPEHVAYAWQPAADAGTGAPTYITSHTGDLLHTYDPLGITPDAVQSRQAIPQVMQQHGVKLVVGHDDSIAGNQISVIDPSILNPKQAQ